METGEPRDGRLPDQPSDLLDPATFAASVRPRMQAMLRTATAILGDEHTALDAVQETLLDAWRALPSLRDPSRFDAWLSRILVNRCRMVLRGRARHRLREIHVADPGELAAHAGRSRDVGDIVAERDAFDHAFEGLRPEDRSILVLHYLDGHSIEGLAAIFGIPEGTAKSRLYTARQALAAQLARQRR
jgi:RNA polymerase sigma-70 factor (ECF subfamily)